MIFHSALKHAKANNKYIRNYNHENDSSAITCSVKKINIDE